jgi:hypothetical protein
VKAVAIITVAIKTKCHSNDCDGYLMIIKAMLNGSSLLDDNDNNGQVGVSSNKG